MCVTAGGNDYEPDTAFHVEIPSGEISVPFSISILDNVESFDVAVFEGNESFSLAIDSSSLPSGLLSDCVLVVTIVDDDRKLHRYLLIHNFNTIRSS